MPTRKDIFQGAGILLGVVLLAAVLAVPAFWFFGALVDGRVTESSRREACAEIPKGFPAIKTFFVNGVCYGSTPYETSKIRVEHNGIWEVDVNNLLVGIQAHELAQKQIEGSQSRRNPL